MTTPLLDLAPAPDTLVLALLRAGIPLTLLLDLAGSDPHSRELYDAEAGR